MAVILTREILLGFVPGSYLRTAQAHSPPAIEPGPSKLERFANVCSCEGGPTQGGRGSCRAASTGSAGASPSLGSAWERSKREARRMLPAEPTAARRAP